MGHATATCSSLAAVFSQRFFFEGLLMTFCHVVFAAHCSGSVLSQAPRLTLFLSRSLLIRSSLISTLLCYVITLKLVCVTNFAHYAHPYAWPRALHTHTHTHTEHTCLNVRVAISVVVCILLTLFLSLTLSISLSLSSPYSSLHCLPVSSFAFCCFDVVFRTCLLFH